MKLYHYLTIINQDESGKETFSRRQINTRSGYRLNVKSYEHSQIESIAEEEVSLNDEMSKTGEYLLLHTSPLYKVQYQYGKPDFSSQEEKNQVENFELFSQILSNSDLGYSYVYCYLVDKDDIIKAQIELKFDEETNIGGIKIEELNDLLLYLREVLSENKKNNTTQTISEIFEKIIAERFIVDSKTYDMPIVILDGINDEVNSENLRLLAKLLEKTIKFKEYSKKENSSPSSIYQQTLFS